MKRITFILSGVIAAFMTSVGINATTVPYNMYVDPRTNSCVVTWEDDENSAWNLRYRLFTEEPEVELIGSIAGTDFSGSGSYYDISLPAPWGGTNVRGGLNSIIYFRNNYNNTGTAGNITYTIPAGYENATFTMKITTATTDDSDGNMAVGTPQTASVNHYFDINTSYAWVVTASSGEKITITTSDPNYSPDIALIEVYTGDATGMKSRANDWTYVYNLDKMEYTIEDLEMATDYEVQVQAIGDDGTVSDWTRPDVFTTLDEEPIIPVVHILGDIDDQCWSPYSGTKMEYDPETELYTATILVEEGKSFGFTLEIDDNEDMGGWNYIEPYRFGPESDTLVLLTDEFMGRPLTLSFENRADMQAVVSGEYEVTVSLERNYVIIGKISDLPHGYALGDVNHDNNVSIKDVTDLIDYLLGSDSGICPICADVTGDNSISIGDVTSLIDKLLSNH